MKKILKYTSIFVLTLALSSCNKFLNVEPKDSLSGNNFWKSSADMESYTREVYRLFRQTVGVDKPVALIGDLRNAPVSSGGTFPPRNDVAYIARNFLVGDATSGLTTTVRVNDGGNAQANTFWVTNLDWNEVDDWTPIYKVIQSANTLYAKAPEVALVDKSVSTSTVKRYQAEAVFMRSLSYFVLLRLFGDVPYYTAVNNDKSLPRLSHIKVAQNCIADLKAVVDDLPWTYDDPANVASRAMRGGALALMMHLHMWVAGFEKETSSYRSVDSLGDIILNEGMLVNNAYELLPLNRVAEIFYGRSRESLFEIPNNVNYGDKIDNARKIFAANVLHYPEFDLNPGGTMANKLLSEVTYLSSYMKKIYPEGEMDGRIPAWFISKTGENFMYSESGKFACFKFYNFANPLGGNTAASIGLAQVLFRVADVMLLQAEALAELGEDDKATTLLNHIRSRANAGLYPQVNNYDNNLRDAIYWERCKELIGEGHYYYDLVRSQKIYSSKYVFTKLMTYSDFLAGAWTWPIHVKAVVNNPHMTLNNYWR